MRFLKLFFLKEEEDIRLLSYKALSLGASIKKDKFEIYIGQHIDSFVKKNLVPAKPIYLLTILKVPFPRKLGI